jgi:hypothetical protein
MPEQSTTNPTQSATQSAAPAQPAPPTPSATATTVTATTTTTAATAAPPAPQNQKVPPAAPSTVTATGDVSAAGSATATTATATKPSTDVAPAAQAQPAGATESIGPRWFQIQTDSQLGPINVLLEDAVNDMAANTQAAIARFKTGHGILHTPFEIRVSVLPTDYQPTAADLDHHQAIEAATTKTATAPAQN